MQMAARSIKNRAGFAGLFRGGLAVGNLVPKATNRGPAELVEEVQVRIVEAVAQAHDVRFPAIVLRRTPEVRAVALVVEIPIFEPVASRQRRKSKVIQAIATSSFIIIPAFRGL